MAPIMRPYVPRYVLAVVLLLTTSVLSLLPPALFKVLIDNGIQRRSTHTIAMMALALIGASVISGLSRWAMEYQHEWVSGRFIADLRGRLLAHLLRQPMQFYASTKTGDILGRLRNDITAVYGVLVNTFLASLSEIVQIVGIAAILIYMNAALALVALSFILPLYLILEFFGRVLRRLALVVRDKDVGLLEFFHERISNIQAVKLFHQEAFEQELHSKISFDLIRSILKSVQCRFSATFLIGLVTSSAAIIIMWYGGYRVAEGGLSFGALFAFYLYTVRLYGPVQSLTNRGVEIYNGLASAQRIIEYFDIEPAIVEAPHPVRLPNVRGTITFRNVSFGYGRNESPTIQKLNLTIPAGQKVALVGPSGAGKTTLVTLLARLYDVSEGAISIDGHDIRELTFQSLYEAIAVVPQETSIFNATIEENIRYGNKTAGLEEVCDAAHRAHLDEFVKSLPQGYGTIVGPRGITLSGGQRQRLALARAILRNAPIWILDEFTSSLDSQSESVVYEQIMPLIRNKTALIIAHRFSTILAADVIAVIDNGQIAEMGSHAELYEHNGIYRKLFDRQFGHAGNGYEAIAGAEDKQELSGMAFAEAAVGTSSSLAGNCFVASKSQGVVVPKEAACAAGELPR
jgi:ABC-type multidrug transport system fused ATPase/permease subunit